MDDSQDDYDVELALQTAALETRESHLDYVPKISRRVLRWLPFENLLCEGDVKSEEVGQFSSCVDLCLPWILPLTEHCRGDQVVTIFSRDQFCSFEKDGCSVYERSLLPLGLRLQRSLNCGVDLIGRGGRPFGEGDTMLRWEALINGLGDCMSLTRDIGWCYDWQLRSQLVKGRLKGFAFG